VKVVSADANGEVLVHLGSGNYLQRYKTYVTTRSNGASNSTSSNRWTCATKDRSS